VERHPLPQRHLPPERLQFLACHHQVERPFIVLERHGEESLLPVQPHAATELPVTDAVELAFVVADPLPGLAMLDRYVGCVPYRRLDGLQFVVVLRDNQTNSTTQSHRPRGASRCPLRAAVRHAESNFALGVARFGLIARGVRKPL
jgi:hypothetical protein